MAAMYEPLLNRKRKLLREYEHGNLKAGELLDRLVDDKKLNPPPGSKTTPKHWWSRLVKKRK